MRRSKGKEYAFAMTYEALSNIRRNVVWHYFLRVFVVASPLSDQRFRCKIQVRRFRYLHIKIYALEQANAALLECCAVIT